MGVLSAVSILAPYISPPSLLSSRAELRTPLHGIVASTAMLLDSEPIGGALKPSLEAIKVSGEHILELVNNVLDIGKIEAKKLSLESIPFRPMDELDAVTKIFALQAEQKKIRLEKVVGMDHPTRVGDPLRFRQVLFNLVSNAIKFTEEGGQVVLRMWDDGEDICTEVEDTGAGIPKEHLSTLFEVRLNPTKLPTLLQFRFQPCCESSLTIG